MEKKNNESNQKIEELNKTISQLKEELKEKDNKFNNFVNLFQMKSSIIDYLSEYVFILNEVQKYTNKKINSLLLLYKATRDGDNYDTFKSRVYQRNYIVILIKNDKGYRFGGFTSVGFEENNNYNERYKADDKAFLFSLYIKIQIKLFDLIEINYLFLETGIFVLIKDFLIIIIIVEPLNNNHTIIKGSKLS